MAARNDHQVALVYSPVLLALVQKTESTADRPGVRASRGTATRGPRWLEATAGELEEVRARLGGGVGFEAGGELRAGRAMVGARAVVATWPS
jgi:hypothetical protein